MKSTIVIRIVFVQHLFGPAAAFILLGKGLYYKLSVHSCCKPTSLKRLDNICKVNLRKQQALFDVNYKLLIFVGDTIVLARRPRP